MQRVLFVQFASLLLLRHRSLRATCFVHPRISLLRQYHHSSLETTTRAIVVNKSAKMNDGDDEFGDPSFLMEVDLDAITAQANRQSMPANSDRVSEESSSAKRRKISISPASTSNKKGKAFSASENDLTNTLSRYYGYPKFRTGQLAVIQSIVEEQSDVAVFWATSSGKSICYQIPALHTQQITIVCSPLISLMKDQVHKLNGLQTSADDKDLATFLGSGQLDPTQETKALQGNVLIVYVTPEKLLSNGFLGQLANLHSTRRKIGLIAIDEAHSISEWGHDFRPEYRRIGHVLRNEAPDELRQIPIMALTATAAPKVQEDICRSLHLRNPKVDRQSFDRPNLVISVHKKDRTMALASAMEPLVKTLIDSAQPSTKQSTIVYASTRNQVEEIVSFLKQRLSNHGKDILVQGYHAGLSLAERNEAHTNFLTGKTAVICATVAFGMGIDKPDTRRVIHFGPPKTLEEYTQQIGRSGRDGIKAECIMYVSEGDFDKYKSDFYLGGLTGRAKDAVLASLAALKSYALDSINCRRKALLEFFKETPTFGERCGTCDNCRNHASMDQHDLERDFGPLGARVVLQAVDALDEPGITTIVSVIGGKTVEKYRYKRSVVESKVTEQIAARKKELTKRMTQESFRELIVPLTQKGYLRESSKSSVVNGFSRTWTTYSITTTGRTALFDKAVPITLPVPESVRETEQKEKERRRKVLAQLEESGVQIDKLPVEEIEAGDGDVIRAFSKWKSYLESIRRSGKENRVKELECLLADLEKWRAETAIKHRMAPSSVLAEHTLLTLSYTAATMPPSMKMQESDLIAAGVRTREMSSLIGVLSQWVEKYQPTSTDSSGIAGPGQTPVEVMQLIPKRIIKAKSSWEYAVYKPVKKTGLASWESSYNRFMEGESPQTIALSPANGRPIQVKTVCCHIMQALLYGKGVDLHRLAQFLPPPTATEWEQLQAAEISTGIDVCGNPVSCGIGGGKLTKTDLLRPIMGDKFADTPYNERDEEEKVKFGTWCDRLEWYMTLRRMVYQPTFVPMSKDM